MTLAMLLVPPIPALAAETWTEASAIEAFVSESPRLALIRQRTSAARADLLAAGVWPNPTLDVEREQVFVPGGSADENRLGVQVPLSITGQAGLRRAIAQKGLAAAEAQVEYELGLQVLEFRSAYNRAAHAQARVETLNQASSIYQRLERIIHERTTAGESAGYDLMRMRLARATVEARLAAARSSEQEARATLSSLLGRPIGGPLRLSETLAIPPSLAELQAQASDRKDLVALHHDLERGRLSLQLASRSAWKDPALSLGLKQTQEPTSQGIGYLAGVSWPLPLFDRGQGEVAKGEAEIARLEAEEALLRRHLEVELPLAREAAVARIAAIQAFKRDALSRLPELVRVAEVSYQEGDSGLIPLLDAHTTAIETQLQYHSLMADARNSLLELERLVAATPATSGRN